jgi:signal transduction histidine kinase
LKLLAWLKNDWSSPEDPELVVHLRYATWISVTGTLVVPLVFIPILRFGSRMPWGDLLGWMGTALLLGLLSLTLMRRRPRDSGALYQGLMVSFWMLFIASLELYPNPLPIQETVNLIPVTVALLTPRRLWFFLGLVCTLLLVRTSVWLVLLDYAVGDVLMGLTLSVMTGGFSLLGSQLTRRLWSRLMRTRQQLLAADRLSALGQHTAGIAHELKSPLASALNEVYSLRQLLQELSQSVGHPEVEEEDLRQIGQEMGGHLEGLVGSLERSADFVRALRKHTSHMHQTAQVSFSLQSVILAATALLGPRLKRSGLRLEVEPAPASLLLHGDPDKLEQVLFNLLTNALDACEASGQGGLIKIQVEREEDAVLVVVQDDGPGVPPALREKIFEPLFTTRAQQTCTGLGLSVCRDIVQGVFAGSLELAPMARRGGARFIIRLPLEEARPEAARYLGQAEGFVPFASAPDPDRLNV